MGSSQGSMKSVNTRPAKGEGKFDRQAYQRDYMKTYMARRRAKQREDR